MYCEKTSSYVVPFSKMSVIQKMCAEKNTPFVIPFNKMSLIQKMSIAKKNTSTCRSTSTVTLYDYTMNDKDVIDYHNILKRAAKHCISTIQCQPFAEPTTASSKKILKVTPLFDINENEFTEKLDILCKNITNILRKSL